MSGIQGLVCYGAEERRWWLAEGVEQVKKVGPGIEYHRRLLLVKYSFSDPIDHSKL